METATTNELPTIEQVSWPHLQALEDNQIDPQALPQAIRGKIGVFQGHSSIYRQKPSKARLDSIKKLSVQIADMIQDFAERELPEDTNTGETGSNKPENNGNQPAPNVQIPGVISDNGGSNQREGIMAVLNRDKRIYYLDLKKIMGHKGELPDVVTVDGLVLERSWSYYYQK